MIVPLQVVDLVGVGTGTAILIVGLMGLLLWAAVTFRNPSAAVMWGISALALLISGVYGIRDEIFWFGVMATVILVIVGLAVRMVR